MDIPEQPKSEELDEIDKKVAAPSPKKSRGASGKRSSTVVMAVIVPLVVIALCVLAYSYFTDSWWFAPDGTCCEPPEQSAEIDTTSLFTRDTYPRIDGSTATIPLNLAYLENFTGEEIDPNSVSFNQTDPAYQNLIDGNTDLILVTEPSADELDRATAAGVELEVTPVVNEGFVFFVNQQNPVSNLSSEQVKQIYEGALTNWNEVGGDDEPIAAFQRPPNSGSQTGMEQLVMKDRQLVPAPSYLIGGGMSDIINIVADYNGQPGAIGYSYYYYATTMYTDENAAAANNIKLSSVDGVAPNNDTIMTGAYPFRTAYYIVINKASPEDSPARQLKDAMLSDRGQAVAGRAGYVPLR